METRISAIKGMVDWLRMNTTKTEVIVLAAPSTSLLLLLNIINIINDETITCIRQSPARVRDLGLSFIPTSF